MLVEILSFEGCPNRDTTIELVARVATELDPEPEIRVVDVDDVETAERLRFLGSPTIRVDGRDIEPGADERTDYTLSCRIYRTDGGSSGRPDERWLRAALSSASD